MSTKKQTTEDRIIKYLSSRKTLATTKEIVHSRKVSDEQTSSEGVRRSLYRLLEGGRISKHKDGNLSFWSL